MAGLAACYVSSGAAVEELVAGQAEDVRQRVEFVVGHEHACAGFDLADGAARHEVMLASFRYFARRPAAILTQTAQAIADDAPRGVTASGDLELVWYLASCHAFYLVGFLRHCRAFRDVVDRFVGSVARRRCGCPSLPIMAKKSGKQAEIMQWLQRKIDAAELNPGDQVPSGRALAQQFGCAEGVAREAVRGLTAQGVLHRPDGTRFGVLVAGPGLETRTPKQRLADSLRARIASGELAPGMRLPSCKKLARESGVSPATASKVLRQLRDEDLVVLGHTGAVVKWHRSTSSGGGRRHSGDEASAPRLTG